MPEDLEMSALIQKLIEAGTAAARVAHLVAEFMLANRTLH